MDKDPTLVADLAISQLAQTASLALRLAISDYILSNKHMPFLLCLSKTLRLILTQVLVNSPKTSVRWFQPPQGGHKTLRSCSVAAHDSAVIFEHLYSLPAVV